MIGSGVIGGGGPVRFYEKMGSKDLVSTLFHFGVCAVGVYVGVCACLCPLKGLKLTNWVYYAFTGTPLRNLEASRSERQCHTLRSHFVSYIN